MPKHLIILLLFPLFALSQTLTDTVKNSLTISNVLNFNKYKFSVFIFTKSLF